MYFLIGFTAMVIFAFIWMFNSEKLIDELSSEPFFGLGIMTALALLTVWPLFVVIAPVVGAAYLGYKFRKK